MIIPVYTPITDAEEAEKCYDQVHFEIRRQCKQYMLLVTEDWNAKVRNIKGENVVRLYSLGNQSRRLV